MLPPRDEAELAERARALAGRAVVDVARDVGLAIEQRAKGGAGEAIERALGATGRSRAMHDFPSLGIELKTIPVDAHGKPRESTFVCAVSLADAERAAWATSWARRKLARVLWVPIVMEGEDRRVGEAVLWRPTVAQEAVLAADFDDIMGLVGAGRVEELDATRGRWLQARPKAAHGGVRTRAFGREGEPILATPRGLYLRARFTAAILVDPAAIPP